MKPLDKSDFIGMYVMTLIVAWFGIGLMIVDWLGVLGCGGYVALWALLVAGWSKWMYRKMVKAESDQQESFIDGEDDLVEDA